MDFSIKPNKFVKGNTIHLPQKLQKELGIIRGQFLQVRGEKNLVLEVGQSPKDNIETALVSPNNFLRLQPESGVDFKILDVTLGCDPEYFVLWGSQFISAATYLPGAGEVGCDGMLGELRPMYGLHENDVVVNLSKLIARIPGEMRPAHWARGLPRSGDAFNFQAHSYFMERPAGFHIHLGIPPEILNTQKSFNRTAMNHLVRCLDYYVSIPTIPLETNHTRRLSKGQYGRPGDYRPSNLTLEYRTPGAFFLRSPTMTAGLLGIALMVVETAVSRMKTASSNFTKLNELSPADLHEIIPAAEHKRLYGIMKNSNIMPAHREIPHIRRRLEELPTYSKHQPAIEAFFGALENREIPSPDLMTNWKG